MRIILAVLLVVLPACTGRISHAFVWESEEAALAGGSTKFETEKRDYHSPSAALPSAASDSSPALAGSLPAGPDVTYRYP